MTFDVTKIAPVAMAALFAMTQAPMAQETAPPPKPEATQPESEAQTTPGVDGTEGEAATPPVSGANGPGYGNSGEPEAAPAQPPVEPSGN